MVTTPSAAAVVASVVLVGGVQALDMAALKPPYDVMNRDTSMVRAGRFAGKVCLVTGATSGLGLDAALHLVAEGCSVAFTGRRERKGKEVEAMIKGMGGTAKYIMADVSSPEDCERMVAETVAAFGRLDAAFNNAGVGVGFKPMLNVTADEYRKMMSINVDGVFFSMVAEARQFLKQGGGGTIVNCGSAVARTSMANNAAYATSKVAVEGLTRNAAIEFIPNGIRVNAVHPGGASSEMTEGFLPPAMEATFAAVHPGGRWVRPEEVSSAVAWLLSSDSSYIAGEGIEVSSGMSLPMYPAPMLPVYAKEMQAQLDGAAAAPEAKTEL